MSAAIPTLTLVVGTEEYLIERAIDEVYRAARDKDPEVERVFVDASDSAASGTILQEASPGLFGGGSVIVLENIEAADDTCITTVTQLASDPSTEAHLVAVHAGGAKGRKLIDVLAARSGQRVDAGAIKKGRALNDFIAVQLRAHKRNMDTDAVALLISVLGAEPRAIAGAIDQLVADTDDNPITVEHVTLAFGAAAEVTGYQISDAVLGRNRARACELLRLAQGSTDGARLGAATTAALASGLRQVIAVATADPGMSDRDLAVEAKVPPWKLRTLQQQARRWHTRELAAATLVLADLDASMKGGLRENEQLDSEQKAYRLEKTLSGLTH